jgi:hypothetical protein
VRVCDCNVSVCVCVFFWGGGGGCKLTNGWDMRVCVCVTVIEDLHLCFLFVLVRQMNVLIETTPSLRTWEKEGETGEGGKRAKKKKTKHAASKSDRGSGINRSNRSAPQGRKTPGHGVQMASHDKTNKSKNARRIESRQLVLVRPVCLLSSSPFGGARRPKAAGRFCLASYCSPLYFFLGFLLFTLHKCQTPPHTRYTTAPCFSPHPNPTPILLHLGRARAAAAGGWRG